MLKRKRRGDTMIEVLLAVTIFSLIAIGGLTIMNQGSASAQRSLELTLVRHEIDTQAEALRVLYDAMIQERSTAAVGEASAKWRNVLNFRKTNVTGFPDGMIQDGQCVSPSGVARAFVVNVRAGEAVSLAIADRSVHPEQVVFARVQYPGGSVRSEGLWIEATGPRSTETNPGYTDFHIRACWPAVGQTQPATIGTIVRLYEPTK